MALRIVIWQWMARQRSSLEHSKQDQGLYFLQRLSYKSMPNPIHILHVVTTGLYYTLHNIGVCRIQCRGMAGTQTSFKPE